MGQANRQRRAARQRKRARAASEGAGQPTTAHGRAEQPQAGEQAAYEQVPHEQAPHEQAAHEQVLAGIVHSAYHAVGARDGAGFEAAVQRMIGHPDVAGWRNAVERGLAAYLRTAITAAWSGGWQPADLVRLAGRRIGGPPVTLLGSLIAADLATYASTTIDPHWAAQLEELDASVWWPPERSCLQAFCDTSDGGWTTVMPVALEVLCLLYGLAKLELLGPIPGDYRPPAAGRGGERPDVEEKVLSRIRALLAKAEATTSEAEAEAFTAGAQERMARYSIDLAMLAATDPSRAQAPSGRRIGIDNPYEASKAVLLDRVAKANRCHSVWSSDLGFCTVLGFAADLAAVETMFTSLLVQAVTAMTRAGSRTGPGGRSRTRSFRQSFLVAYASRIGERLEEITNAQTRAASAEPGGANVLPVLASRNREVDEAMAEMFPQVRHRSAGSVTDAEGWHSGRGAADLATLQTGAAVGSRL